MKVMEKKHDRSDVAMRSLLTFSAAPEVTQHCSAVLICKLKTPPQEESRGRLSQGH